MIIQICKTAMGLLTCSLAIGQSVNVPQPHPVDRTVLPIREPARSVTTVMNVRDAKPPARFEVNAPKGAPNVVVVLIDDMGFATSGSFGGPINMPTLDRLAQNGLRYNRFHTTALCAPTRVALLSGYNHHSNNMGVITELASTYPGYTAVRPQTITPMAEVLRQNGYNTAQFGKCHEVPPWEISNNGPQDRWPTRSGFEKFYGFLGGETNQWAPLIYDGVTMVETPSDSNYHFTTDMTNQAIGWMRQQQSLQPDKPFFIYFAPGATHAPHHAPASYIEKYKGKFDKGWDAIREESFARQKKMGIIPEGTQLAPKPKEIKDWETLSATEKKLFARQMEVYAAFAEHTDDEIGRLINAIDQMGALDNTIFIYIAGDNGASAEGQMNGMFSEMSYFNQVPETVEGMMQHYDAWGSPATYPHFAAGWAVAMDAPFTWTKQMAADFGGVRNGMVIHWPAGIKEKGGIRQQFGHVIDIAPTVYEITGIPAPKEVNGIKQDPIEGKSLAYTFQKATAPETHSVQYFEMFGNRAIYEKGWLARAVHKAPYLGQPYTTLENDKWELYNTLEDFSLSKDLANANPAKLKSMQTLFLKEAAKYHVLPLDDRTFERMNATAMGRPTITEGRNKITYYEGMKGLGVDIFIDLRGKAYVIETEITVGDAGNGAIVCQGGRFGGFSLYMLHGKPAFCYNFLGLESTVLMSQEALPPGTHSVRFELNPESKTLNPAANAVLYVNNKKVGETRIKRTQSGVFSVDDLADIGMDEGTQVTDYGKGHRFNGKIKHVTIETK